MILLALNKGHVVHDSGADGGGRETTNPEAKPASLPSRHFSHGQGDPGEEPPPGSSINPRGRGTGCGPRRRGTGQAPSKGDKAVCLGRLDLFAFVSARIAKQSLSARAPLSAWPLAAQGASLPCLCGLRPQKMAGALGAAAETK